jgi:Uma2 family endonuclease
VETLPKLTSADLELLPEDGKLYELIEGELYVSRQPSWDHQYICLRLGRFLDQWSEGTGLGVVNTAPGLIFAEDDDVAPDLVWISQTKLAAALGEDRKLHSAPELVVEVLSPGLSDQQRDRQAKLKLYSRRGVQEYWIVNGQEQELEVYRHDGTSLLLWATLGRDDLLESPLLPGFSCRVSKLFFQNLRGA